ncbi:MAG: hypothetical protein J0I06_20975, partial [Planctomycetes bacterium]|nr:hypothetical protein [Planctomycetota bacterium]
MIRTIAREKFVNRTWTVPVLDDLGAYWSDLCRMTCGVGPAGWKPKHAIELRISGFPRAAGPAIRDALNHRYWAPGVTVTAPNPDEFVVQWKPTEREDPPAGLGLPLLTKGPFEGLIVEIRFAVANRRRALTSTTTSGWTLVVLGELRNRALIAK